MQHYIAIATNLYISRENWLNATSPIIFNNISYKLKYIQIINKLNN